MFTIFCFKILIITKFCFISLLAALSKKFQLENIFIFVVLPNEFTACEISPSVTAGKHGYGQPRFIITFLVFFFLIGLHYAYWEGILFVVFILASTAAHSFAYPFHGNRLKPLLTSSIYYNLRSFVGNVNSLLLLLLKLLHGKRKEQPNQ